MISITSKGVPQIAVELSVGKTTPDTPKRHNVNCYNAEFSTKRSEFEMQMIIWFGKDVFSILLLD